eukprot:932070-Amphidinium_carterae.1
MSIPSAPPGACASPGVSGTICVSNVAASCCCCCWLSVWPASAAGSRGGGASCSRTPAPMFVGWPASAKAAGFGRAGAGTRAAGLATSGMALATKAAWSAAVTVGMCSARSPAWDNTFARAACCAWPRISASVWGRITVAARQEGRPAWLPSPSLLELGRAPAALLPAAGL